MSKLRYITVVLTLAGMCSCVYGQEPEENSDDQWEAILKYVANLLPHSMTTWEILDTYTQKIVSEFDEFLKSPESYRERVFEECGNFPEGRVYAFAIPALGYANLAIRHPDRKAHAIRQMSILIDLIIPVVAEDINAPNLDLMNLKTYQKQATYLGTLNLVLANYALIGGDNRYEKLYEHLSGLLSQAMVESNGESLSSYPEYTWHIDTIFVLTSLFIHDKMKKCPLAEGLIRQHLEWKEKHATHKETGLPVAVSSLPRGCDLSIQICLLAQISPETAEDLYEKYVKFHWADLGFISGFSEWPKGTKSMRQDIDSGPVIFGIAMTATGVGIGTTQAMNDEDRIEKLCSEMRYLTILKKIVAGMDKKNKITQWFNSFAPFKPEYLTGFLYGDSIMFYALTWVPYVDAPLFPK